MAVSGLLGTAGLHVSLAKPNGAAPRPGAIFAPAIAPELFSPIAPRPRHHRRYWRLALELREIEEGIARYLGADINDVLEARDARRVRSRRHPA